MIKYATITEQDQSYRTEMGAHLESLGLTSVSEGVYSFEGSDELLSILDGFHGITVSDKLSAAPEAVDTTAVENWLKAYNGNFSFLLDMKRRVMLNKGLSPNMIAAVNKCIARDAAWKAERAAKQVAQVFTVKAGDVLEISKGLAMGIRNDYRLARTYYNLEVKSVLRETAKAVQVEVIVSAKVTSHCCVCGRSLTDAQSIGSGIGPICADKNGIPWGDIEITKEFMQSLFAAEAPLKLWLPKSGIKNYETLQNREAVAA